MPHAQVLFLTCHLPYPPVSGGRRREYELLTRLSKEFDVHLFVVSKTYGEDLEHSTVLEEFCSTVQVFPAAIPPASEVDGDNVPFQVLRHRSQEASAGVARVLRSSTVDLVHVEAFYMMQHVPDWCSVPIFLQEQNIEYVLWRQRTEAAKTQSERQRSLREYLTTLEAEIQTWTRSDLCAAITEEDRRIMTDAIELLDVRLVPDGADHLVHPWVRTPSRALGSPRKDRPLLAFVANFGYQPNIDAALYFCEQIFPHVLARIPAAQLLLVGNAPPPELEALSTRTDAVVVTGRVRSVEPFIDAADVVVCPLRIGGGIKVKVLEALCRGKAVVTTSVGAQGLGERSGEAMRIRDDPLQFAKATARLLNRPGERRALERAALRFARRLPTWDQATSALIACYDDLLSGRALDGQGPLLARS